MQTASLHSTHRAAFQPVQIQHSRFPAFCRAQLRQGAELQQDRRVVLGGLAALVPALLALPSRAGADEHSQA